jgi:hypothetical protein
VLKASASFEPFELGVTEDKVGHAIQDLFGAVAQLLQKPRPLSQAC